MSKDLEMEEVRLDVGRVSGQMGESDDLKPIKFEGAEIARHQVYSGELNNNDDRGVTRIVYKTEKGNFLLYTKDWSRWQGESSHYSYKTYESLEEIESDIPDGLAVKVKENLGLDPAEELDV